MEDSNNSDSSDNVNKINNAISTIPLELNCKDLTILKTPRGSEDPSIITTTVSGDGDEDVASAAGSSKLDDREGGLTYIEILINFLKGMIGIGCLSLPLAFRKAGLMAGFCLVFALGYINFLSMHKLVRCAQRLSKRNGNATLNYGEVGQQILSQSFGPLRRFNRVAKIVVNACLVCIQMGCCSAYFVFCAENIKEFSDFQSNNSFTLSISTWMFLIFIPMVLINSVRSLRIIAVLSSIGNVLCFVALAFIFQHLIRADHLPLSSLPSVTSFGGVMSACGAVLYSLGGQTIVLPLEKRLKRPSHMVGPSGILSIGMTFVSMLYVTVGFFGYITYGTESKAIITENLPEFEIQFMVVKLLYTLVMYIGFVLQMYIIVDIVWPEMAKLAMKKWPKLRIENNKMLAIEQSFRAALVVIAMSIGLAVPDLDLIISLTGVTIGMLLALVWPALLDLLLFLPIHLAKGQKFRSVWTLIEDLALIAIGIFGLVAGLSANIEKMMESSTSDVTMPMVTSTTEVGWTS